MEKITYPLVGIIAIGFTLWFMRFFFIELSSQPVFVGVPVRASRAPENGALAAISTVYTQTIRVQSPSPKAIIKNPLIIEGEARGMWFFEGVFPIRLVDERGKEIARGQAHARSEWMTDDFVPFQATLYYQKPAGTTGTILLEKDNPSGLPQHAALLRVPIRFQ